MSQNKLPLKQAEYAKAVEDFNKSLNYIGMNCDLAASSNKPHHFDLALEETECFLNKVKKLAETFRSLKEAEAKNEEEQKERMKKLEEEAKKKIEKESKEAE